MCRRLKTEETKMQFALANDSRGTELTEGCTDRKFGSSKTRTSKPCIDSSDAPQKHQKADA